MVSWELIVNPLLCCVQAVSGASIDRPHQHIDTYIYEKDFNAYDINNNNNFSLPNTARYIRESAYAPPPCADLDLVDWTWLTGPGWRDLVDRTWLTSPGWPSRYVSELSFVWLILFAIVLLQIVPFRSYMFLQFVIKIVSFQWFCFPCQNCIFSVSLFRIDIVQFLPFQNCQCPDASLSDVFFLSCS